MIHNNTRLHHPEAEKIQQGAIFNCASVQGYESWSCSGIVMTARCDLEHDKQSVVNYLPIVPFDAWVKTEMCYLVAKRLSSDLRAKIENELRQKGVSDNILHTFPLQDIVNQEIKGKRLQILLTDCANLEMAEMVIRMERHPCTKSEAIIKAGCKIVEKLTKELIQQKLGEYYFLNQLDVLSKESKTGGVVLLRHMQTIDSEAMSLIVGGVLKEDFSKYSLLQRALTFDHEPICMVTGVLRSPDIEHLMQSFASLFVRIGLVDQDLSVIDKHIEIAKGL